MPGEYTLESSEHKSVNIPILQMLHTMFKNTNLLDKIQETQPSSSGMYVCQCSQVQSTCHTVSFAMQSNWPAKMSLWKCSFPSDKRLAHSWAGWHFHWNTGPVSWVSQLIIWRPMVLQVLCNLFEDTPSADSVAEKFKTAKFQMVSLPREQRPDMINMCAMLYGEKMQRNLVLLGMCSQQEITAFSPHYRFPSRYTAPDNEGIVPVELALCICEMILLLTI